MPKHNRGMLLLETIIGLTIVSALLVGLVVATGQRQRSARYLDEHRRLIRQVERTMTDLQLGRKPQLDDDEVVINIDKLPQPSDVPGMQWVMVRAEQTSHIVVLIGLVPQASASNNNQDQP